MGKRSKASSATPDLAESISAVLQNDTVTGVVSSYLFGSEAEGRAHRESDVDVGVLLQYDHHQTARDRFESRLQLCADLGAAT